MDGIYQEFLLAGGVYGEYFNPRDSQALPLRLLCDLLLLLLFEKAPPLGDLLLDRLDHRRLGRWRGCHEGVYNTVRQSERKTPIGNWSE